MIHLWLTRYTDECGNKIGGVHLLDIVDCKIIWDQVDPTLWWGKWYCSKECNITVMMLMMKLNRLSLIMHLYALMDCSLFSHQSPGSFTLQKKATHKWQKSLPIASKTTAVTHNMKYWDRNHLTRGLTVAIVINSYIGHMTCYIELFITLFYARV